MSEATRILDRVQQGDPQAADELLPLVYDELRKLAAAKLAREPSGHTLQPTALVHEAWLRLIGEGEPEAQWSGRGHFLPPRPKPCAGFWLRTPAVNTASNTEVVCGAPD